MHAYRICDDGENGSEEDISITAGMAADALHAIVYSVRHKRGKATFFTDRRVSKGHLESVSFLVEPYRISRL